MGAAASVDHPSHRAAVDEAANAVSDTANCLEGELNRVHAPAVPTVSVPDVDIEERISAIGSIVRPEHQEAVLKMITGAKECIPVSQLGAALTEIERVLPTSEGAAALIAVAAAIGTAAHMAPEIIGLIGEAVVALGEHLPYIGVVAGAIGALVYTFRLSTDQDNNVKTVTTWLLSVKDWLFLVATKVSNSSASSTIPLFEALQDAVLHISDQMDERNRKWRITKMLSSTQFERDFTSIKTAIIELKTALRDFLDEETQNRQEAVLANIAATQIDTNEKLASIDDQLGQIREMLKDQAEKASKDEASKNTALQVREEEEAIYINIQRAAGVEADVAFSRFVSVFEAFFYNGSDMPPEQRRALKISILRDSGQTVSKASWVKFYRLWTSSGVNMEQYLVSIAEANPTAYQTGLKLSNVAISRAKDALAAQGIHNVDDLKAKASERMSAMGINLPFGKKKIGPAVDAGQP